MCVTFNCCCILVKLIVSSFHRSAMLRPEPEFLLAKYYPEGVWRCSRWPWSRKFGQTVTSNSRPSKRSWQDPRVLTVIRLVLRYWNENINLKFISNIFKQGDCVNYVCLFFILAQLREHLHMLGHSHLPSDYPPQRSSSSCVQASTKVHRYLVNFLDFYTCTLLIDVTSFD